MTIEIAYSDVFFASARRLKKRYPHIREDIEILEFQIKAGETPGDRVQNVAPYVVYKARVKNRDAKRGKSGGYRAVYYVKTEETVLMLDIYSKSEQEDIDRQRIVDIIRASEQSE